MNQYFGAKDDEGEYYGDEYNSAAYDGEAYDGDYYDGEYYDGEYYDDEEEDYNEESYDGDYYDGEYDANYYDGDYYDGDYYGDEYYDDDDYYYGGYEAYNEDELRSLTRQWRLQRLQGLDDGYLSQEQFEWPRWLGWEKVHSLAKYLNLVSIKLIHAKPSMPYSQEVA